jgi:branched-chain amino acid transport system substrate-binding protein
MDERSSNPSDAGITRRDVLRLSGIGAIGIAGSALLAACSSDSGNKGAGGNTAQPSTSKPTTAASSGGGGKPTGKPIRIGASLALTGPLSASAILHKTAGDLFVERLNNKGGLLGRPVEWIVLDDESQNDKAAAAYERLITEQKVDLITGPYGTGTISAAMKVAQRYNYVFTNSTGSLTYQYNYKYQFPSWSSGRYPNVSVITGLLDMLKASGKPIKKIAVAVNTFPGSNYLALGTKDGDDQDKIGAVDVISKAGIEVVKIEYPINISDWGPIAAQIRSADPDFICDYGVGLDAANLLKALKAINYKPKGLFGLWSAPGPLAALGDVGDNVMLTGFFLPSMPQAQTPAIKEIVQQYADRAKAAKTYPVFETQAESEWVAWEYLTQGVEGAQSLDNQKVGDWLRENGITSELIGKVKFNTDQNNYPDDISIVAQLQKGTWQCVWPTDKKSADLILGA